MTTSKKPARVLIVDDDDQARRIVAISLSLDGNFEVAGEASDGKGAIDTALATMPDIILLDLEMPGMNGMEAIPELRKCCPHAKIAVISSFPDPFTLTDALSRGADTYLDKATGLSELPIILTSLMDENDLEH